MQNKIAVELSCILLKVVYPLNEKEVPFKLYQASDTIFQVCAENKFHVVHCNTLY